MNILIQAYMCAPDRGGEFAVSWGWLSRLEKRLGSDDQIYVVSDSLKKEHLEEFHLDRVKILRVNYPQKLYGLLKHTRIWFILWQRYAYLAAMKSGIKFNLVHVYSLSDFRRIGVWYKMPDAISILGPVGGGQKCPDSLLCYDNVSRKYRDIINLYCKYSPLYKNKVKKYTYSYACNYETQEFLPGSAVLPDVPLNDKLRFMEIPQKNNPVPIILFCGRLINKKGLLLLIDSIAKIDKSKNFEVHIYGEGSQQKELEHKINSLNLQRRIFLKGFVHYDQMSAVYQSADIFVMPSLRESGGSVLIEAMAHKLPIVALNMALPRILNEYDVGRFVDTRATKDAIQSQFASYLTELISNKELREQLGNNGYNYVNTELTWDKVIDVIYGKTIFLKNKQGNS